MNHEKIQKIIDNAFINAGQSSSKECMKLVGENTININYYQPDINRNMRPKNQFSIIIKKNSDNDSVIISHVNYLAKEPKKNELLSFSQADKNSLDVSDENSKVYQVIKLIEMETETIHQRLDKENFIKQKIKDANPRVRRSVKFKDVRI